MTDVGNGKTYSASVVGYSRTKDIAVLQLHGASGLQTATIGDSSKVSVGEDVVGIGNAGGTGGTPSAAGGTVTALNQSITASDEGDGSSEQLTGLIETNADIQAGRLGRIAREHCRTGHRHRHRSLGRILVPVLGPVVRQPGLRHPDQRGDLDRQADRGGDSSSTVHIGATAFLGVEVAQSSCSSGSGRLGSGFGSGFGGGFGSGTERLRIRHRATPHPRAR